jgi:hypothetical protein
MLMAVVAAVPLTGASASASTGPAWAAAPAVPVPAGTTSSVLNDVTILAPDDVWAVGEWVDSIPHPLAVHWNGAGWIPATLSDLAQSVEQYSLQAVDGVGADQVWAVGNGAGEAADPLVLLHYDGVEWSTAPGPVMTQQSALADVDMSSVDNGWAVGATVEDRGAEQPLILRWTSDRWARVPAPAFATGARLNAVYTSSPDEAWAVGERDLPGGGRVPLVLRWKGTAWLDVPVPSTSSGGGIERLSGVASTRTGEVWAVGSTCPTINPATCRPIVLRGGAGGWSLVPASSATATLTDVVAVGPDDVWLFGHVPAPVQHQANHAEHWDGQSLTTDQTLLTVLPPVAGDSKPDSALALAAAAGDPQTGVLWAVGWSQSPNFRPNAVFRR